MIILLSFYNKTGINIMINQCLKRKTRNNFMFDRVTKNKFLDDTYKDKLIIFNASNE